MIKAAFFDVDGTLLSHKSKSVPQSARNALDKLKAAGIRCIVATGRQIQEMDKLPVKDLSFDGYITLNGQLILDGQKRMLHGTPILGETRAYLLKLFREHSIPILMVQQDRVFLNFVDERVRLVQAAISSAIPPLGEYEGGDIYQACVYMADGDDWILEPIADACVMTRWSIGGVDVIAKGGGKLTGIRRYLEENGLKPEEVIAFGDGENDMEMLQYAGIGVAMGNADEEVKAVADYVTADIDDDGIEKALRHFGLME